LPTTFKPRFNLAGAKKVSNRIINIYLHKSYYQHIILEQRAAIRSVLIIHKNGCDVVIN
jgi:hypothetical protein